MGKVFTGLDKMEVLVLMAHLKITILIIGTYVASVLLVKPDNTLEMAVFAVIGYWFGAVGKNMKANNGEVQQQETKKGA